MSEDTTPCAHCGAPAIFIMNQWVCAKHYRFRSMRYSARHSGKKVPSRDWLEANVPEGMVCPCCSRVMNWRIHEGRPTVITLQHNRDGTMAMICQSCNSRHQHMPGDSFYSLPEGMRRCPKCGEIKPRGEFASSMHPCVPCHRKVHQVWRSANREAERVRQAAWKKANLEKRTAAERAYREANPDKIRAMKRAYRLRKKLALLPPALQ